MLKEEFNFAEKILQLFKEEKFIDFLESLSLLHTGTTSILLVLGDHPEGIGLSEIADILNVSRPRVTVACHALKGAHLISKRKKKGENYKIFLTSIGEAELEKIYLHAKNVISSYFGVLKEEEQNLLLNLLYLPLKAN